MQPLLEASATFSGVEPSCWKNERQDKEKKLNKNNQDQEIKLTYDDDDQFFIF